MTVTPITQAPPLTFRGYTAQQWTAAADQSRVFAAENGHDKGHWLAHARLCDLCSQLAATDGWAMFPALFTLQGEVVAVWPDSARQPGLGWIIDDDCRFVPSTAADPATRRLADESQGYRVGRVAAQAAPIVTNVAVQAVFVARMTCWPGGPWHVVDDGTGTVAYQ